MKLDYVPLLPIQRELQAMPRDPTRFQHYLRTIYQEQSLVYPPLSLMNPMAKDHVTRLVDDYLALEVDRLALPVMEEAAAALSDLPGEGKIGLVVLDDLMGGWTNRYAVEFSLRFDAPQPFERDADGASGQRRPRWLKDFWLTGALWSSEPASERAVREAILLPAYRLAYVHQHGPASTLRERMAQEGQVMVRAHCAGPVLDADDLDYTREVLAPFLDVEDTRTCSECLFGDEAGRTLGFTPRGLSLWAGLALALHDEQRTRCVSGNSAPA